MEGQLVLDNLMFAYMNDLVVSRFLCVVIADWLRERGRDQEADIITSDATRITVHYTQQPVPVFAICTGQCGPNDPWTFSVQLEGKE